MTTLRHEVQIDAPLETVWKVLSNLAAVQEYNPLVASARVVSKQGDGVGATRRCELKPKGFVEERVWSFDPPRSIGLEVAASDWPIVFMKWKTELEAKGDSTRMTQEMSYKLKFGPIGAMLDALVMKKKLDQSVSDVFGHLKRYVERDTP
jgi:ligand-binding SRPBCC domain-containing protein